MATIIKATSSFFNTMHEEYPRTLYTKYPKTFHLPWSPGKSNDDKVQHDLSAFIGKRVVITEKMDGENTTIYPSGICHARSIDSCNHPSRHWVTAFSIKTADKMPDDLKHIGFRLCGENLYAKHSIHYQDLESYFLLFNVWEKQLCFNWDETIEIARQLDISTVPVLYDGIFDELLIKALPNTLRNNQEGFVMRLADEIDLIDWGKSVVKWVRPNHIQTNVHWFNQEIIKNNLINKHI